MLTADGPGLSADGWLTLTEAAARTGHTREAIRQRIRRGSLRAVKDNSGVLRIGARDLADLPPLDATTDDQGDANDTATDAALAVLVATVADLRADLGQTRTALDAALTDRGRSEQEREEARVRAASAEGEAKTLREALVEARAIIAHARRPAWQRWLGIAARPSAKE